MDVRKLKDELSKERKQHTVETEVGVSKIKPQERKKVEKGENLWEICMYMKT